MLETEESDKINKKAGFQPEVCELAARLGPTGYCRNPESGDVLAEPRGRRRSSGS